MICFDVKACDITIYVQFITSFHHNKPNPHIITWLKNRNTWCISLCNLLLTKRAHLFVGYVKVLKQNNEQENMKFGQLLGEFTYINLKMGSLIVWILSEAIDYLNELKVKEYERKTNSNLFQLPLRDIIYMFSLQRVLFILGFFFLCRMQNMLKRESCWVVSSPLQRHNFCQIKHSLYNTILKQTIFMIKKPLCSMSLHTKTLKRPSK